MLYHDSGILYQDILFHTITIIFYTMSLYPIPCHCKHMPYRCILYHVIISYTMSLYPIPCHYILYHVIVYICHYRCILYHVIISYTMSLYPIPCHCILYHVIVYICHTVVSYTMSLYTHTAYHVTSCAGSKVMSWYTNFGYCQLPRANCHVVRFSRHGQP